MTTPTPDIASISLMGAAPYSRENVRKGIVHYLFGRSLSAVAGFFTIILLVRHMAVTDYAAYTAIFGLTMMAGMLAGLGMERALTRFIPEGLMHHGARALGRFIWVTSLIRLLVMVAIIGMLYLGWPLIAANFSSFDIARKFPPALGLLLLATAMFQLLSAVMQALVQQKTLTRVLVVQWGGRLGLILLLIAGFAEITLDQALWLMAVPDAIGAVILAVVIQRYLVGVHERQVQAANQPEPSQAIQSPPPHAWPSWPHVRRLALDNYGYNLLAALPQSSTMIILAAAFLAAPFVAAYGFYISVLDRLKQYLPLQFMLNLVEPLLIAGYVKDRDFERLCHHSRLLYKFNLLLLMPALAWIAAIAPQLTSLLTGGRFAEYAWIFPVLLLQIALGSHATIIQIIINAVGKSKILTVSGCAALAAMGVAIAAVLATGRVELLVCAPLAYELANNIVAVVALAKTGSRYDPQWRFHCKLIVATVVAYGCALFAIDTIDLPLAKILMAGTISLVVFGLIAALLRIADSRDFETLKDLLQRKR